MGYKARATIASVAAWLPVCLGLSFTPDAAAGPVAPAPAASAAPTDKDDIPFDAALVNDLADGRLEDHTLTDAALIASGVHNEEDLAGYRLQVERILLAATARVSNQASPVRRARRLLAELHRVALRKYEASSDRFTDLLDRGVYNCVSATLLYIMAARAVGLDPAVAETPLHVFVMLDTGQRRIDIEATTPGGFDMRRDLAGFRSFVLANKYVTTEELARKGTETLYNEFHDLTHPVTAERAIAFLYHNAGLRQLQSGSGTAAARYLINAARIYPELAYRSEDLRTALAWAVREQYDAGDYLGAFRMAEVTMSLFPDRTTVRDRFIAVAARAVEEVAGKGDLAAAEQIEARAIAQLADEESRRKFETFTAPAVARAGLYARDWPLARRAAARFRAASLDPVEAERFAGWVESRVADGESGAPATSDYIAQAQAAVAGAPEDEDSHDYAAVVRAIAALAGQGRFEEALAVGRIQRAALHRQPHAEALDILLKAVAGCQINTLLKSRRWQEAILLAEAALAQWPGDGDLLALDRLTRTAMAQDPYRLGVWPEAVRLPASRQPGPAGRARTRRP